VDLVERVSETDVGDRASFAAAVFVRENSEKQPKNSGRFCCYFGRPSSRSPGFLRRTRRPPLIISGKNSENSEEAAERPFSPPPFVSFVNLFAH
jgi:hypothetical protein